MLMLLKQGKGFFHIGSSGHEASQIAIGSALEGGRDWFSFYYRDLGTALAIGIEPVDVLRAHFAKATDPNSGGRQMSEHFSSRELNLLVASSSVGAQFMPAIGVGLAIQRDGVDPEAGSAAVYASGGEGSTSQGAFHESLNWAAKEALPVLFHIQDNKYAISVPVQEQTAGGSIWHLLGGYEGLARVRYDGTDFFASASVAKAAVEHLRTGKGPVALHADVVRLLPHSSSDDHKKYREDEALEADRARDPIPQFVARLVEAGVVTEAEVDQMRDDVKAEIDALARQVDAEPDPDPATATTHVYYEGEDRRAYEVEGETGDLVVMVDAINHALDEEMARDERVLVYGEDVGGGKGGVFTATRGLTAKHGADRCFNSPLAEHSVIGSAVGLAASGYKPVVEIQFADYIWPGLQPLRNQVASFRYRSNGEWGCPMVIRVPCGGYIHGGLCHSQNIEAFFGHFPGLHVVMPSNAADAKGLLKAAIRGEDPVLFLEHKSLYRQGPARSPEPHADYLVPLGKARVAREGTDLTIVTWGALVYKALNVAKTLEREGVSAEVIDVRSILPFDTETVIGSACKTNRVLVAYEDHEFMGFGAEVAAQVADRAFGYLDAPVKRVAGAFSSIPFADPLEKAVLPQDDDILAAAREVLAF
ncbi:MAG: dehydrogenase E1 component subunit alpha/beta [Bacteroidota bacterium]